MTDRIAAAPKPEVLHLPTLFRRIDAGEIRIPRFQRPYVWREKNIIELLESVYHGYPVGSLLFWRPMQPTTLTDSPEAFGRMIPQHSAIATYVLDGQQRLTTLYRCFFRQENDSPLFDIVFDLDEKKFSHRHTYNTEVSRTISLAALFSTRELLQRQQTLLSQPNGDVLADAAIELHARFQEYMLPVVMIEGRDVSEVVEIFERVNRTGSLLNAVDFMRAVTWSTDFDLQHEVANINKQLAESGFEVADESIVKLVAIAAGRAPTAEDMVRLRKSSLDDLKHAVALAHTSALNAIEFFRNELGISSYDYVPYEAQFLVICRALQCASTLPPRAVDTLRRWFWASSFNEALRGTPDNVTARLVVQAGELTSNPQALLVTPIGISAQELVRRRFAKGRALSGAAATLFSACGARSIVTGNPIERTLYMTDFVTARFRPLSLQAEPQRLVANIFLCTEADQMALNNSTPTEALVALQKRDKKLFATVLDSQLLSQSVFMELERGRTDEFLLGRAERILSQATRVTKPLG